MFLFLVLAIVAVFIIVSITFFTLLFMGRAVRSGEVVPDSGEMKNHMYLGFYCNPNDPRTFVPRPPGQGVGTTMNVRSKRKVVTVVCALVICLLLSIVLAAALPFARHS